MVLSPAELADVSSINFSCSARLELIGFEQIKKNGNFSGSGKIKYKINNLMMGGQRL